MTRGLDSARLNADGIGEAVNLDPLNLAHMALGSASARKWALANLRYVVRHLRESAALVELTGALICLLGGTKELRRIADSAETSESDSDGHTVRLMLLSGYWRSDEAQRQLH
ncbi:MAG: hypothetical protein ACFCUQ_09565 [Kiloniellales bacterium]